MFATVAVGSLGLAGSSSYYLSDYFSYWSDGQLESHFSKMIDEYKAYLNLVFPRKVTEVSSGSESSTITKPDAKAVADAWTKVLNLYKKVFVEGSYHKLPDGVKAFGFLKILSSKRIQMSRAVGSSSRSSNSVVTKGNPLNLDKAILRQINVIYDNFHKIPESVLNFFSLFMSILPNSGVEFLGENIPVPATYLFDRIESSDASKKDELKKDLFKVLASGQRILRARTEKQEKEQAPLAK